MSKGIFKLKRLDEDSFDLLYCISESMEHKDTLIVDESYTTLMDALPVLEDSESNAFWKTTVGEFNLGLKRLYMPEEFLKGNTDV